MRIAFALVLALTAACGGRELGGGDAGVEGGPRADGPLPTPCPAALPVAGGACSREGLVCAYGDDPRPECRTTASCRSAAWQLAASGCAPLPPATCPPSRAAADGQPCAVQDAWCGYDGLGCHCTNCTEYPVVTCGGQATWKCAAPNADPVCPPAIPNLGGGCAPEGKVCTYGCEPNMARRCVGGVWMADSAPGGCPI
jgi:hypothetical protein